MRPALTSRRVFGAVMLVLGAGLLVLGSWQQNVALSMFGLAFWIAVLLGLGVRLLQRINAGKHFAASNATAEQRPPGGAKPKAQSRPAGSTVRLGTPVYGGMASIPSRVQALEQAVSSIYDQVDGLFIYLNNYDEIPPFLQRNKISVFTSQDFGDIKDSGKFFGLTRVERGIYLSLDDDIQYPPDYAHVMKKYLARFRNKCVIGVHGIFFPALAHSFFDRKAIHFEKGWDVTVPVSMLGTGTTAFSIVDSGINFDIFKQHGMADISLAVFLKERLIPAVVIRRNAGWLRSLTDDDEVALYRKTRHDSTEQTAAIVAARPWGLSDLCTRTDRAGVASLLPGRWHAIVAAYRDQEEAVEMLGKYPLAMLTGLIRTLMNNCEAWNVAKVYEPTRPRDISLHCSLLKNCLSFYPEEVLRLCGEMYSRYKEHRAPEAIMAYAKVYLAGLRKLSMYEEADKFYRHVVAHGELSSDLIMEYLRLKAQERDHQSVLSLARERYIELSHYEDFVPIVYGAVAQVDGLHAALPGFIPSFFKEGRRASRRRRSIIAACKQARVAGLGDSLAFEFASAETSAARQRNVRCLLDLILFYVVLGENKRARSLLEKNKELLDAWHGAAMCALIFAVTASHYRDSLTYINKYNENRGLVSVEITAVAADQSFFSGLKSAGSEVAGMDRGRISIVIAAFNAADTVGYAVQSILAQSYRNIEVIVVDDASTDRTWEELETLRRSDARVKTIRNGVNAGPYVCRNIALAAAEGSFVAIHDADDFAHPQRLERQMLAFDRKEVVAVFAAHIRFDRHGLIALENNGEIIGDGPVTLLCRHSVFSDIGEFEPVRTRGDIEFKDRMKCYYGSHRLAYLDEVLVYALHDPASNSHAMMESPEAKRNLELFRAHYNRRLMLMRSNDELSVQGSKQMMLQEKRSRIARHNLPLQLGQ